MSNNKFVAIVLTVMILLAECANVVQAQGGSGCPANPPPAWPAQYQVLQSIELALPITENVDPNPRPQMVFFRQRIDNLIYQPETMVILASTADGRGVLCTDDKVRLESSTGRVFEHDFRAADRSRIVPLEPLDVTGLFDVGLNSIEISLGDISPAYMSSSPYYLVVISSPPHNPLPAPAEIFTPPPPTSVPIFTPSPTATATAHPTVTPSPTLTPTAVPATLPSPSASSPWVQTVRSFLSSPRKLLGLVLLIVALILALVIKRRPRFTSWILKIEKDGQPWKTVDMSAYGGKVTIGSEGQIKLEDDEDNPAIPAIVARLVAQRSLDGDVQLVWQPIDDSSEMVVTAYQLNHGDVEVIGPYRLVFENFSQSETAEDFLEGGIWNEI